MSRSLAAVLLCIVLAMMMEAWAAYEKGFEAGLGVAEQMIDEKLARQADPRPEPDSVMVIISCAGTRPDTAYIWRIHVRNR